MERIDLLNVKTIWCELVALEGNQELQVMADHGI